MALKKIKMPFGNKENEALEKSLPPFMGTPGAPVDRGHPFYFGFLAACGAVIAITVLKAFASASQVFVLIIISLFLAAGLNPSVEFFRRRGLKRPFAVLAVVFFVLVFVGIFSAVIIPPAISQLGHLVKNAPKILQDLKSNTYIGNLNKHYGIIDSLQAKFTSSIHNGQYVISAFGGVIGVGRAVLSGAVASLTVLILTLYFLASLPSVTGAAYRFVPACHHPSNWRICEWSSNGGIYRINIWLDPRSLSGTSIPSSYRCLGLCLWSHPTHRSSLGCHRGYIDRSE
jgi:hypothetical protein